MKQGRRPPTEDAELLTSQKSIAVAKEKDRPKAIDKMDAAVAYEDIINFCKQCKWRLKEALVGIQATKYHSFSPEF